MSRPLGTPIFRNAKKGRDVWLALRSDSIQKNLVIQGLLVMVLSAVSVSWGLETLGLPLDWSTLAVGVVWGAAAIVVVSAAGSVAYGVAFGVSIGTAFGVASGVAVDHADLSLAVPRVSTAWRSVSIIFWKPVGNPVPIPNGSCCVPLSRAGATSSFKSLYNYVESNRRLP